MLKIKKLRYKNFLGSGNTFTEFDLDKDHTTLIIGKNGAGKAQPLSSLVGTPYGFKKMGDLRIGDDVLTQDGSMTKIVGVFPQGKKNVFEITFRDGRTVRCCSEHLWRCWGFFNGKWQWKILPLKDIKLDEKNKIYVPLFEGTNDKEVQHKIDPYLIGALLGDGSFVSSSITFSNKDIDLLDKISTILENTCIKINKLNLVKIDNRCNYRINYSKENMFSPFKEELSRLNLLNKKSYEKDIPVEYMNGSFKQKLELIRGLMDTDGFAGKSGCVSFTTTSRKLAYSFRTLLWSIGAIVNIRENNKTYIYKREKKLGRISYTLLIRYKNPSDLFFLTRKKERVENYQYKNSLRLEIKKIKNLEIEEEMQCISVEHPSKLYITDDYVVTHNTTFMDALSFVFFNKPFREDINKPDLLNKINGKDCYVEVEFEANGKEYKVFRGMSPAKFGIVIDGELQDKSALITKDQKAFEKSVLRMSHETFVHIILLGVTVFTPFMKLKPEARRTVIEDILQLKVLSVMGVLSKRRQLDNRKVVQEALTTVNNLKEMKEEIVSNIAILVRDKSKKRKEIQSKVDQVEIELIELKQSLVKLGTKVDMDELQYLTNVVARKIDKLDTSKRLVKDKLNGFKKNIVFYSENKVCPTCTQDITEKFRTKTINENNSNIKELEEMTAIIKVKENELLSGRFELQKTVSESKIKNSDIEKLENIISQKEKELAFFMKELSAEDTSENSIKSFEVKLKALNEKIESNKKIVDKHTSEQLYADALVEMLKDDGLRAVMIKKYIPVLNAYINEFLTKMDFFCSFEITETFETVIKSRKVDEFKYGNFSNGEKMRINLAILFAFRKLVQQVNSVNCNILVFDEVFDSALDDEGVEDCISVIKSLTTDLNVLIISHKSEVVEYDFDKVIKFKKYKDFSIMEEGNVF